MEAKKEGTPIPSLSYAKKEGTPILSLSYVRNSRTPWKPKKRERPFRLYLM